MTKLVWLVAALAACKNKPTEKPAEPPPPPAVADAAPTKPAWDGKTRLILAEAGFSTPESVLYDADADLYLISNINGKPLDADDNGYIRRVHPDGVVDEAIWIDGAKEQIKLDAPKGMAISGGILWVSDITVVRKFDAKSGEPKGEVKIDGATFLNDVAAAPEGGIYVTDSGLDATFSPTGTDAVHHVDKDDKVRALIKDKAMGGPNGVAAGPDGSVWIVTFRSGELYQVDAKGKKQAPQKLPKGQLDGVVALDGGELLVSSWEGETVYRGKPGGAWASTMDPVKSPADIGWDAKRKRILVPSFQGNAVVVQPTE